MVCPDGLMLLEFLDDRLAEDAADRMGRHVEQCAACQQRLEEMTDDDTLRRYYDGHERHHEGSEPRAPLADCMVASSQEDALEATRIKYERLGEEAERDSPTLSNQVGNRHADFDSHDSGDMHGHPKQLGRFRLKRLLGKGGFGVVYLARDELLNRHVALKLPLVPLFADPSVRSRFLREAKAAGRLQHPNIVPVYDAGQIDDVCFLSSAFCAGPTLAEWLQLRKTPPEPRMAAEIMLPLAEAVQHAHDRHVLHRDIKPGNILLELYAAKPSDKSNLTFIPFLTDFGLAKTLDNRADTTATAVGIMMGTPRYLAPEQAAGLTDQIGPASDVYALGAVLYEILTLKSAVQGDNNAATLTRVISNHPERPRRLVQGIPGDLEAICLKCLEKSPQRRYASAQGLADDLRRFLRGRSTVARPLGPARRFGKWSRRNPAWSALVIVVFLSLSALGAGGWWSVTTLRSSLKTTRNLLYAADVRLAAESLDHFNSRRAEELLHRHIPVAGEKDRRGFVWNYLWSSIHCEQIVFWSPSAASVWCTTCSIDGKRIAGGDSDGKVWVWDAANGDLIAELQGHSGAVRSVNFSPDGQRLVSAGGEDSVRVWDLQSNRLLHQFRPHDGTVYRAFYSVDGDLVATCGADEAIRLWRTDTWTLGCELVSHTDRVYDIAFSTDGRFLVSAGKDGVARLWNLETRKAEQVFVDPLSGPQRYECIDISPDNRWVAAGTGQGKVMVWDVVSGQVAGVYADHTSNVLGISFSPDGHHFASASKDSTVRIRESESGKTLRVLQGHGQAVYEVCYAANGAYLFTCGKDGAVRIWNRTVDTYDQRELHGVRAVRGEAGGRYVAMSNWGQRSYLYDTLVHTDVPLNVVNASWHVSHAFSRDGRLMAAASGRVIDPMGRKQTSASQRKATAADVDGDGDQDVVGAIGRWGHLVWQEADEAMVLSPPKLLDNEYDHWNPPVRQVVDWSGQGEPTCFIRPSGNHFRVFPNPLDSSTFEPRQLFDSRAIPTSVWPVDIDMDGDQDVVVTTREGPTVVWWENDGKFNFSHRHVVTTELTGPAQVIAANLDKQGVPELVVTCRDGRLVVLRQASRDGHTEWVMNVVDENLLPAVLDARDVDVDGAIDLVMASRERIVWYRNVDGHLIAPARVVGSLTGATWLRPRPCNVVIWDVKTKQPTLGLNALSDSVRDVALSPDGKALATAGDRGVIRLWDTDDGRVVKVLPLMYETDNPTALSFSRDGKRLLFAAGDNAYVWSIGPHATAPRRLSGHNNTIEFLVASPTQDIAATISHDFSVKIWNLTSGDVQQTLVGHSQQPMTAGFSPNGKLLATAGNEGEIILWDVETGQELLTLTDLQCTRLAAVQFIDERTLVAIGERYVSPDDYEVRVGTWRVVQVVQ